MLATTIAAYSQLSEKMQKEGVVPGIIFKNSGEIAGYIKKTGYTFTEGKTYVAPWEFQSGVKFIPKDVFENNEKIKNKYYEKYEPKDCDGFKYDTLKYESVKYSDMSAVGMAMVPKKMFMRVFEENKITLFFHYNSPPAVVGSEGFAPYYEECAVPNLVYRVGKDGKLKLVNNLNVEKELADCPYVVEKQQKGEYKAIGDEENDSKGNKFLNNALFRENVRLMVIEDYNKNCK
jgi:hypothetical protein